MQGRYHLIRIKNKTIASGIWYTVSNFLLKALSLISTPIFTRLMGKEEFGDFSVYVSVMNIASVFIGLNAVSTMLPAKYDYRDDFDRYIRSITIMGGLSSVVFLAVMSVWNRAADFFSGTGSRYLLVMSVYLFCSYCIEIFQTEERLAYKYKASVFLSLYIAFFTMILSVLLTVFMQDKLSARIIGSSLPAVLAGGVICRRIFKKERNISLSCWKYALPICLPYIPHVLSLTLLNSMDKIMIQNICGPQYAALYSVSYTCGRIVTILTTSLNTAYVPWLADKLAEDKTEDIRKFSNYYFPGYCLTVTGMMLFAPEVLRILGGKSYMEGIYVIVPVAMGCICQFVYIMYVNIEQIKKKTAGMAFASISAAVLNFILNAVFIPRYGYLAAAYTTLAGYLWLMSVHMLLVKKMKLDYLYNEKYIISILKFMFVIAFGIGLSYQHIYLRIGMILGYTAVAVIFACKFRKTIMNLLKQESGGQKLAEQ